VCVRERVCVCVCEHSVVTKYKASMGQPPAKGMRYPLNANTGTRLINRLQVTLLGKKKKKKRKKKKIY